MTETRCTIEFICDVITANEEDGSVRFKIGDIVEMNYSHVLFLGLLGNGQAIRRHDLEEQNRFEKERSSDPIEKKEAGAVTVEELGSSDAEPAPAPNSRLKVRWLSLREACEALKVPYSEAWRNNLKNAIITGKLRGQIREGARPVYQVDAHGLKDWAKKREKEDARR